MYVPTVIVIFFQIKLMCDIIVRYYKSDKDFFQWTSISQFPKQRVMSKYSEYILKKKASLPVIPLHSKCLNCTCAHMWHTAASARVSFFWDTFPKTCWEMPSSLIPTFATDLSPSTASVTHWHQRLPFHKMKPELKNLAFFRSDVIEQNRNLCTVTFEARDAELHIPAALHTNGGLHQSSDSPEDKSVYVNTFFYCSLVLDNWKLVSTAAGEFSICWIPKILAQP